MSSRLNFPIWADADTTSTGFTLQHLVNGSWVNTDMRTCALPAGYTNEVCLSRYIEKDIKSTAPNLNVATGITLQPDAYQIYRMVLNGVPTLELGFFNDWSYEMFTGDTRCISAPINRHADSRQKLVYGNFAETGNSILIKEMIKADIKMQPNVLSIGAEAAGHTITAVITSNMDFELILPEWLTASQTAFTSGTTVTYLYPQNNTSFDSRQFTIQAKHEGYWDPDYEYTNLAHVVQSGKVAYLTIYPDPLGVAWDTTGLTSVTVYTNTDFTATTNSSDTWLTYSGKTKVGTNYYIVNFNISANTGDVRQTHAYFEYVVNSSGGTYTRALRVVQAKAPDITIEPQSKEITAAAQGVRIRVTSDFNWVASTTYDWLSVPSSGVSGVTLIFINTNSNVGAEPRSGSVLFSNGARQTTFNIVQSASTNTIRYTSTDDTVIVPNNTTGFGATYVDSVYYPESHVGYLLFDGEPTSIGARAFNNKNKLTSIEIPETVTSIGEWAFHNCTLSSITIPSGVTDIGEYAFNNCPLASIIIPDTVTTIKDSTFESCSALSSLTIGSGVTTIGYHAFASTALSSLTIPENVSGISEGIIYNCNGVSSITVNSNNTTYNDGNGSNCVIETSSNTIIIGCKGTTIPNTVTAIGDYAFASCSGLSSITIPDSVTSIGKSAFSTSGIESVTMGSGVTNLGRYSFEGCSALTSVVLSDSLTYITEYTFTECTALSSITIGSSMNYINRNAFYGCTAIAEINYNGTMEQWSHVYRIWPSGISATGVQCTDGFAPL